MAPFAGLALAALSAAPVSIDSVVVLDLRAQSVDQNLALNLSELMLSTARAVLPDARVVAQSELKAMLAVEQQKMMIGCEEDASCLAEIGGALGADHLVTGSLGRIGSIYLVNLKLIDTAAARVVRHVDDKVSGDDEELITSIERLTREMLTGQVALAAAPQADPTPIAEPELEGGAEPAPVDPVHPPRATAVEEGDPWYTKWWVWGIVGVVAAGAVVGIVLATSGGAQSAGPQHNSEPARGTVNASFIGFCGTPTPCTP